MYKPHVEELEARDLLNSSLSPHLLPLFRVDMPSAPAGGQVGTPMLVSGYLTAPAEPPLPASGYSTAPAEPPLPKEPGDHSWSAGVVVFASEDLPPGPGKGFIVTDHSGETFEFMVPQGMPEFRVRALQLGYGASATVVVGTASEGSDLTFDPAAIRVNAPTAPAVQSLADINRTINVAGVDPSSANITQRLTTPPTPRLDTLAGLAAIRLDPQTNAALRNAAVAAARDAEIADTPIPASAAALLTIPRAQASDSAADDTQPPLPVSQQGSAVSVLPALDVAAVERAMQQFLRQLQSTRDELAGKHDKAGLGVWLVAGTAAVAACEIARRQMRASRAKLAVEWNWIAGVPPDLPFGQ